MSTILTVFFSFVAGGFTMWGFLALHTRSALHRLTRAEQQAYDGLVHIRWEQAIEELEAGTKPAKHSLAGDGITDDTAAIQARIPYAP